MDKQTRIKIIWSLGASVFWVTFLWDFWSRGVYALGLNAFIYLMVLASLFLWSMSQKGIKIEKNWFWIMPIGLIILSFLLYDNPFLKSISILVLPVLFAIFYNFSFVEEKSKLHWDSRLVGRLIFRGLSLLGSLGKSISAHTKVLSFAKNKNNLIRRVVIGVSLLLVISLTIIIPLLSSADTVFADSMKGLVDWFRDLISTTAVYKIIIGILFSVATTAGLFAWGESFVHKTSDIEEIKTDSVIVGIILGGILVIYLFFLFIQIGNLWVGSLPFDFIATEQLVKSGFWQLLMLSIINIVIYFFAYRKTVRAVQKILGAFTIASLLLLSSAAYRMGLYITYYGLSYEKLFASYTVIFCTILFVWLISRLFIQRRSNILKFLILMFLWMYALATVFPVEQFVLRTNVALSKIENSRIRLYELTMLSPDVLGLVKYYQATGQLKENQYYLDRARQHADPNKRTDEDLQPSWGNWIRRQEIVLEKKSWYEKNITNSITELEL